MRLALRSTDAGRQANPSGPICSRLTSKDVIGRLATPTAAITAPIEISSMQTVTARSVTIGLFGRAGGGRMQSGREDA